MHCNAQFISSTKIYDDLIQLVDEEEVFLYPVNELIAAELAVASPELRAQRLEVLNYWCERKKESSSLQLPHCDDYFHQRCMGTLSTSFSRWWASGRRTLFKTICCDGIRACISRFNARGV